MTRYFSITNLLTLALIGLSFLLDHASVIKKNNVNDSTKIIEAAGSGTGTCVSMNKV